MTAPTLYDSLPKPIQHQLLEKYRYVQVQSPDWADQVMDNDIAHAATLLGVEIRHSLWDINERDGFRFIGSYKYNPLAHLLVFHEYPKDEKLQTIAVHLHYAQPLPYTVSAKVSIGGYRGDFATNTLVELEGPHSPYPYSPFNDDPDPGDYPADWAHREERVTDALQDFMRWAFKQIQAEHDYLTSDECVIEYINDFILDTETTQERDTHDHHPYVSHQPIEHRPHEAVGCHG